MITGAGSSSWNSFEPVTKVPDTLLEVNGSKISESDPKPTIISTWEDLIYPVRRLSAFGHRKVPKFRSALTPDPGSAAPPDVTVCVAKDAGCLFTDLFNKKAFTANAQQRFAVDCPDRDLAVFSREQYHLLIAFR